jgi:flagellin
MEVDQLVAEIDRLASAVQFNQIRMLKGGEYDIHVGSGANETIRISISSVDVDALGIRNLSVTGATNTNAENAVTSLDAAISLKIMARSRLGSYEVRLGGIVESLRVMQENQAAARSRIMDLDFAKEVMNLTRNQILVQVGLAMLAQANLHSQAVLNLL